MRNNTVEKHGNGSGAESIDAAVSSLVFSEAHTYGTVINTPLMFPDGGSVVVQITGGPEQFLVSDMGLALYEAEMMGASHRLFCQHAAALAEGNGIGFDQQAFFVTKATPKQLTGAIKLVANCSLRAVHIAAYRLADRNTEAEGAELYERLVHIFGKRQVSRDVKFSGKSTHSWPVRAKVDADGQVALFETATSHHASVVNIAAKFGDIARLEAPPKRITVVKSKSAFGDYLGVLTQSSTVIEGGVPRETYEKLVAA